MELDVERSVEVRVPACGQAGDSLEPGLESEWTDNSRPEKTDDTKHVVLSCTHKAPQRLQRGVCPSSSRIHDAPS